MRVFLSLLALIGFLLILETKANEWKSDVDIESLARIVCETTKGTKKQITHVHQVSDLVQFFQQMTNDHKLFACRILYLESLEELQKVVSTANEDACGQEKIKLVEDFHRSYVSKVSKYVREQKRAGKKAPKMAKLFFMSYAARLSSICEQSAVSYLETKLQHISDDEKAKVNQLKRITDMLGMSDLNKGWKGTYLFWNMADALGLASDKKFSEFLGDHNQEVRLNLQMKNGRVIRAMQALCRQKLNPIVSKTVSPVLHLADMGYYPGSDELLSEDSKFRTIFLATQMCEILHPIRVFDDESLTDDHFVALKREEAAKLAEPIPEKMETGDEVVDVKPASVADLNAVVSQVASEAHMILESIKANVVSRSKVFSKMLRMLVKQIRSKLGQKLHLFARNEGQKLEAVADAEDLSKVEESEALIVHEEDGDDEQDGKRVKRGFWRKLGWSTAIVGYVLYIGILFYTKIFVFGLPSILLIIIAAIGGDSKFGWYADHTLQFIWKFGCDPTRPIPNDIEPIPEGTKWFSSGGKRLDHSPVTHVEFP